MITDRPTLVSYPGRRTDFMVGRLATIVVTWPVADLLGRIEIKAAWATEFVRDPKCAIIEATAVGLILVESVTKGAFDSIWLLGSNTFPGAANAFI